jgi:hypothetical protein
MLCSRGKWLVPIPALVGMVVWLFYPSGPDTLTSLAAVPELAAFVRTRPNVPVVFTSRSDASSFQAAAPEGEGFVYPGTIPWAAREGRLRLLDVTGQVYELTWGKVLADGATLIDVMSPSISLDGARVLFAGRQPPPDAGHWRIYELNLKTGAINQRTGSPQDQGCSLLPPLRYAIDGTTLPPEWRRRIDYDDVDPTDLGDNSFAFASSRIPDLGRDHAVRASQIWLWQAGMSAPNALTANRNNDRWPAYTSGHNITFSSWSRNREAVTADRSAILPVIERHSYATSPTDNWLASEVSPNRGHFGYAIKSQEPVWRPRPLFNGRLSFMTSNPADPDRFRLAQADWGYTRSAPSSLSAGMSFPNAQGAKLYFGPECDSANREISAGCPSPCPGNRVLFAGKIMASGNGGFGLYSVADDWNHECPLPELLFDDPRFEDAEPVAVYARDIKQTPYELEAPEASSRKPASIRLADGKDYFGPAGCFENLLIRTPNRNPIPWVEISNPEGLHDPQLNVVPPPQNVEAFVIYAAYRDRFDDPVKTRIKGEWKKLLVAPAMGRDGSLFTWVPSDQTMTTVLAGLDQEGKIAQWSSQSIMSAQRTFFAYAGDHYSQVRVNGYHHCVGCHAGHSYATADIRERVK